jgi:hypothetical protein
VISEARIKAIYGELAEQTGERLARAAVSLMVEHQKRLSIGNPSPHNHPAKPGEYPKLRTGFGRANTTYDPQTPAEMAARGYVDVGIGLPAFYLEVLASKGWLGMLQTFQDTKDETLRILNGESGGLTG